MGRRVVDQVYAALLRLAMELLFHVQARHGSVPRLTRTEADHPPLEREGGFRRRGRSAGAAGEPEENGRDWRATRHVNSVSR